jgi:hypothetical protein
MSLQAIIDGDSWASESFAQTVATGGSLCEPLSQLLGVPLLNLAHAGDSSEVSMGLAKQRRLAAALPGQDVLFFSSGGDDIAGDQFCGWLNRRAAGDAVEAAINWANLRAGLDLIMADYRTLVGLRDRVAPQCLIVTHSYDFPAAEMMGVGIGAPVTLMGPWLQPGLEWMGWQDTAEQVEIVHAILSEFDRRMMLFAQSYPRICHARTQGTLGAGDWDNEIHPNRAGWMKVATVINAALLPWLEALPANPGNRQTGRSALPV